MPRPARSQPESTRRDQHVTARAGRHFDQRINMARGLVVDEPRHGNSYALDEICQEGWLVIDTGQGDNRLWKPGLLPEEPYAE